jgi:WD40 repeat protein/serine/threonine protein kinase
LIWTSKAMTQSSEAFPDPPDRQLSQRWRRGERPDVADFLAGFPRLEATEVVAVLLVDQRERWQVGERVPAESYLRRFPSLEADSEAVVELAYGEFLLREERSERPTIEEYLWRFLNHQTRLRLQVELHLALRGNSAASPEVQSVTAAERTTPEQAPAEQSVVPIVPGYEILDVLGRGGVGVVYKARQVKANRLVALKMLLAGGHASAAEMDRFRIEAEAIARLQHPNIVAVFEVGEHQGVPFFSLEFCPGGGLDGKLAGTPLPPREAATLVECLALAVQAAHDKKIVHRDLKPANVLLSEDGTPRISDFGLARKLDEVGQTQTGSVMGTPSYMAPEQAQGRTHEVGPLADVYALGAILYQCLTGRPPFQAASYTDTVRQVLEQEPVPPRRLNDATPRDLETICLKCLHKEQAERYRSAAELADDLHHFLSDRPIKARRSRSAERLARWCRRNPLVATSSGLTALALMIVLVLSITFAVRERHHSSDLSRALRDSRYQIAQNYLDRALAPSTQTEPDERLLWLAQGLRSAPDDADDLKEVIRLNVSAWRRVLHKLRAPLPHSDAVLCLAFSPEGDLLLSGCADGTTRIWNTGNGEPAGPVLRHGTSVLAVAFDHQGGALAAIPGEQNVRIVDVRSGKTVAGPFPHEGAVVAAAWSGDGRSLVTGSADHTARVWELTTSAARTAALKHDAAVISVALSLDGKSALTGTLDGKAQLWDVARGQPYWPPLVHPELVSAVAFAPHGGVIVTGCGDNEARLWDVQTGKALGGSLWHRPSEGTIWSVVLGPDDRLLTGGDDGTARVWSVSRGESVGQALAHQDEVRAVAFSRDGRLAASGGYDRIVRLWQTAPRPFVGPLAHGSPLTGAALSRDGKRAATAGADGSVQLWDTASGRPTGPKMRHGDGVHDVLFSHDGRTLLTIGRDGFRRWLVRTGQGLGAGLKHVRGINEAELSPDGKRLALASADHTATVWQAGTDQRQATLPHGSEVHSVTFHPWLPLLLTGCADRQARLWDLQTNQLKSAVPHEGQVWSGVFRPDGKQFVTCSDDSNARLWWVKEPQPRPILLPHLHTVRLASYSDDSKRLATASYDHTARIWDADTGAPLTRPLEHHRAVLHVAFQPGGWLLATGSMDHTARLWDTRLGRPVGPPLQHQDSVTVIGFDRAGKMLLTGSKDGNGRLWPMSAAVEGDKERIILWTECVTGKKLDSVGAVRFLDVPGWQERRKELAEREAGSN